MREMETDYKDQLSKNDILIKSSNFEIANKDVEYDSILLDANLPFYKEGNFLWVENPKVKFTWVIYVTVIVPQFKKLINNILPALIQSRVSFKIPENQLTHSRILDGAFGLQKVGKIIAIYPDSNESAL